MRDRLRYKVNKVSGSVPYYIDRIKCLIQKWLTSFREKRQKVCSSNTSDIPFIDLTPVDDADSDGTYSNALSFAFKNHRIRNIALTGPYGSGKSSIIRTFEKNSNYKFLNISLASFKEEKIGDEKTKLDDEKVKLIEKSILQQMLYGADANKLPYSRFKRILTPEYSNIKSTFFVIWFCIAFYFHNYSINPLKDLLINPGTWPWIGLVISSIILVVVPIVLVRSLYKASFGVSLKKLSLKNAEIETSEFSEDSILNRHLDEIIYFFQTTNYNAVVVEDLDRFGDPEIFVRLREINALINSNRKSEEPIIFLYALKDDMFVQKNRAKFFDFIIPVVPIINNTNSLDMMQRRLEKFPYNRNINPTFLREVSFYIDDLRLIHNIFNEFKIYYEKLKSDNLNITKLLAMMIYKNVYPNDFEKLHYGTGALFDICKQKTEYQKNLKNELLRELEDKKQKAAFAKSEKARSTRELIGAYLAQIISCLPNQAVYGLVVNNQHISFSQMMSVENFEHLVSQQDIQVAIHPQVHPNHRRSIGKSFSQLENEINPGETFVSRLSNIKGKNISEAELKRTFRDIETKIDSVANLPISQLMREGNINIDTVMNVNKVSNGPLLIYLVRNGYLDDSYYLYTSNFYEGRLTKSDWEYIRTIRDFGIYDPTQIIDTPKEVCENIREEDFGNMYALNVILVDYLLESKTKNLLRLVAVFRCISTNYEQTKDFFSAYLISGKHIDLLVVGLCEEWPEFVSSAININYSAELLSAIVNYVDADKLNKTCNPDGELTGFLSNNGYEILASGIEPPESYAFLKELSVRFSDLSSLDANDEVVNLAIDESLFEINIQNILYILKRTGVEHAASSVDPEKANYTAINESAISSLNDYIDRNLAEYIENVFLSMPDNDDESEESIVRLLNKDIDDSLKVKILEKENHVFNDFENVPITLWPALLENNRISATWANVNRFMGLEDVDKSYIEGYLSEHDNAEVLSTLYISKEELGEGDAKSLSRYILNSDYLDTEKYEKLVNQIPYYYSDFPDDISEEKKIVLCNLRKVRLREGSFSSAAGNNAILVPLLTHNIEDYLKDIDKFPVDDAVREKLIDSEIDLHYKIEVVSSLTPASMSSNDRLAQLVGKIITDNEVDLTKIDQSVIEIAIQKSEPIATSIRLLTKCILIWEKDRIMNVISGLSEPYSDIASLDKSPVIPNNEINLEFAKLLDEKNLVSSIKEKEETIQITTHKE